MPSSASRAAGIAMVAAVAIAWSICSQAATVLKFGYILPPESQLGAGAKVFAAEVARGTGGRYTIEDYPNAMLGGEVAMMRDLQLGAIDAAFITGAPLTAVVPEAGVFNIPFLFPTVEAARSLFDSEIGGEYLRKFDGTHIVALAWGENGMRHITNSRLPIRSPADLVGLKLRIPQSDVMEAGFKAMGVKTQQLPFPQVFDALRSGQVDGEENPIATIVSSQFSQVQKHLTLTGHIYDPAVILLSSDTYEALSDADRIAFRTAARLAARASREAATLAERQGLAELQREGLVVVEAIDKAPFAAEVAAAAPFFDRRFGRDVIARIKARAGAGTSP